MRIDNSNETVREMYPDLANDIPVDLCIACYAALWEQDGLDIDHPDYGGDAYTCVDCGEILTAEDN